MCECCVFRARQRARHRSLYQGKDFDEAFDLDIYDFHARQYDPVTGRFLQVDPMNQFASGFTGMGNNWPNGVDPDGKWAVVVGAAIGGFFKGIQYASEGKGFFNGFWRGALVGAVGGLLGNIGTPGVLVKDLAISVGSGLLTNGLGNTLDGNPFFQNALTAVAFSAAFSLVTSDNFQNLVKNQGFISNNAVLDKFAANGDYQGALKYFKMDADFDPNGLYRGLYDPRTKNIVLSKNAFFESAGDKSSFDLLNSTYHKELWHKMRHASSKFIVDVGDNWQVPFKSPYAMEDALGHVYMRYNQGAWPSTPFYGLNKGFTNFVGKASNFARKEFSWNSHFVFNKPGFGQYFRNFPRRFRTTYNFIP